MSTPNASNLACLKAQADFASDMARVEFKNWLALHRRLVLLTICEESCYYACASLKHNKQLLQNERCKPIRELIQIVLKVQKDMERSGKAMKEWAKKEWAKKEWAKKEKRAHGARKKMSRSLKRFGA